MKLIKSMDGWIYPPYLVTRTVTERTTDKNQFANDPTATVTEEPLTPDQEERLNFIRNNMDLTTGEAESYVFEGVGDPPDTRTLEEKLLDKVLELDPKILEDETIKSSFPVWQPPEERDPFKQISYQRFTFLTFEGVVYKTIHPIRSFEPGTPPERPELYTRIGAQTEDGGIAIEEWRQPTGMHDAYKIGDKVTWKGQTWVCTLGDGSGLNSWEPGVYGWEVTP